MVTGEGLAPEVVVMDVMMPKKDGIDACRGIMELLPDTRVLMLTASNVEDAVIEAVAAGATGYVLKYARPEELETAVLDVAEGRLRLPDKAVREARWSAETVSSPPARLWTSCRRCSGRPCAVCQRRVVHQDRRGAGQEPYHRPEHPQPHTGQVGSRYEAGTGGLGCAERPAGRRRRGMVTLGSWPSAGERPSCRDGSRAWRPPAPPGWFGPVSFGLFLLGEWLRGWCRGDLTSEVLARIRPECEGYCGARKGHPHLLGSPAAHRRDH